MISLYTVNSILLENIFDICTYESIIGLIGNSIACIVISCSKSFRNLTGFYLLNLSVADLILMTTLLGDVTITKFNYGPFLISIGMNYVYEWIFETATNASTLTVTMFTVERYLAICHPFFVQSMSKKSRAKKIIIGIWLISAIYSLLSVAVMSTRYMESKDQKLWGVRVLPYVIDVWATISFFIPMMMITVMYILIWMKLKASGKGKHTSCQVNRADIRTMLMFVTIVGVFMLSWGPYYTQTIWLHHIKANYRYYYFAYPSEDIFWDKVELLQIMGQISFPIFSILNPLIYSAMSKNFREAFKDLVLKITSEVVHSSSRLLMFVRLKSSSVETTP